MARSLLTTTVPADDDTTRKLISLPMCPCGDGPVSRFITVGTDTFLGCDVCFRACHTRPEVTHHTRSSHLACEHDATPRDPRRADLDALARRGPGWEVKTRRSRTGREYVTVTAPDGTRCTWYPDGGDPGDLRVHKPNHRVRPGKNLPEDVGDTLYLHLVPMS